MKWANKRRQGFTIVELLVVIVVIGILVAISAVAYSGIQSKARASAASSNLEQIYKKLEIYRIQNNDNYPSALVYAGIYSTPSLGLQYTVDNSTNPATYCTTATVGTTSYFVNSSSTTTPISGACPGHTLGGAVNITNLATNPGAYTATTNYDTWGGSYGTSTLTRQAVAWSSTGYAARATWTVANTALNGDAGLYIPYSGDGALQANTQYTASWWAVCSRSQKLYTYMSNWRSPTGSGGSGTFDTNIGTITVSAGIPAEEWVTFTTGSNTTGVKVYSTVASSGTPWQVGDYLEVSKFMIVKGATKVDYRDGGSAGWAWNGVANNSSSTGPTP